MIQLHTFLFIAIIMFGLGLYTIFTRKNVIGILLGIELLLNASGINFLSFNYFRGFQNINGHIMTIFAIVLAAIEAVVALAIVIAVFQQRKSLEIDKIKDLKA